MFSKLLVLTSVFLIGATAQAQTQRPAAGASQAATPVPGDPQVTTASFGDWVLRCVRNGPPEKPVKACEIVETLQVQGQGTIAQIAVSRPSPKDPIKVTVVLPNNITFPSSVKLALDEKDNQPADLAWRRCLPGGCFADGDVKDDVVKRWRASERGEIRMKNGAGQDVIIPLSFRGLAPAMDALAKS